MGSLARLGVFLRDHSHDLGMYLQITCTVRGQLYCVYEVTHTTRGIPTGPLARLGVYLRIAYMFMECVPAITRTTSGVPLGSLARFRGVCKVSLTQAKVKNLRSWQATTRDLWHAIWGHRMLPSDRDSIDATLGGALIDKTSSEARKEVPKVVSCGVCGLLGHHNARSLKRLSQPKKKVKIDKELLEAFKKVEVNLPLLTTIKSIPRYTKFLKELCTHKRRSSSQEKVMGSMRYAPEVYRAMTIISVVLGRTFHHVDEILPFRYNPCDKNVFRMKKLRVSVLKLSLVAASIGSYGAYLADGSEYRLALLLVVLILAHELEVVEDVECKFI
ncbi:Retrovirus-related Pol polyprotein from transposon opus [Cucumis melo var. makuwa]|uniref:Retrovirus-related Pol polyprotein from transposon opus n=1 Tax=Cucumis melo var. makuwa TaxID=1194695 RepID=A0A5A7V2T6_CUCMM|nr:Retrovirus-related Pol polyprotein from transposon opus [Cucumis melo var. makuwa]